MNPQMDNDVINLAKSIRQTESGGDFNAKGKSQESGAYQWTPDTWKAHAQQALGNPNAEMTPDNQNAVAYTVLKSWKDKGLNPAQIAAKWNSGSEVGWENKRGVNKFGVQYDVPKYVKSVTDAYQQIKGGAQVNADSNNPSSTANTQVPQPEEGKKGFLKKTGEVLFTGDHAIFPGKQVGEAIGTLGGYAYTKAKDLVQGTNVAENYDLSAPKPTQVLGDVAQGALTVGAGMPGKSVGVFGKSVPLVQSAKSALGRIGQASLLGAGLGATGAVAQGDESKDVVKKGLIGGAAGGVLGVGGELMSKASQYLPERIVRSFVPGINEETAKYAVNKGMKAPEKMLQESEESITSLGTKLGNILKGKEYEGLVIPGKDFYRRIIEKFPDSGLTEAQVFAEIKKLAKLKSALVDKLQKEGLNLSDLHSLNSELGKNTFKTVFDDPTTKAGKEVGSAFYHAVSDAIKGVAKETEPIFATLSKEYPLRKALEQAIRRGQKSRTFTLKDLVAIMSGFTAGGPLGGLGGYLAGKGLSSPSINMKAGALIKSLGDQKATQALKPLLLGQIGKI